MKKLKFNSTLNHKQSDYKIREIIVEKVITLYGKSFSELKDHPLRDDPYIAENRDLMYIDNNDTAHCLLMVDYDSGDGILVESEGCGCPVDTSAKQKHRPRRQPRPSSYARKSQFIPNAEALIEISNLTLPERKLHRNLKKIVDHIAELAHCGEKSFVFEELLEKSDLDFKSLLRDSVTAMLKDREDVKPIQAEKQMVKELETMFEEDNSVHISTKAAASDTALNPQNTVSENSSPQTQLDDDDDWD